MQKESEIFHQRPAPMPGKVVPSPIGSMNYNVLRELLDEARMLQLNVGAEIGVFEAATSEHLLRCFPDLRLHCVDPWVDYTEHEQEMTQSKISECEQKARAKLDLFGDRANIIKDFSVNAAKQIQDGSLDFIFIDAIHTFEAVTEDLTAWYPKVRPNGLVAGHDFSWPGIQEAVEQFIAPLGKGAFYSPSTSDIWFFVK